MEELLSGRTVETDRIEFKEGWNLDSIYRSICAFANDFENLGGGYIVIGVAENEISKTAQRPVKGLSSTDIVEIQRKMIGFNHQIQPVYNPKLFIETVDYRQIIVLWIPGGSDRPYQVPEQITALFKKYHYYIRQYANSVKAGLSEQQELISLANQVPFDDRTNTLANIDNISMLHVKDYLRKVKSKLTAEVGIRSDVEILRQMELVSGPKENIFPRNVALMLFNEDPSTFFPYTQVEVVEFQGDESGDFQEFDPIKGPITAQIGITLTLLKINWFRLKLSNTPMYLKVRGFTVILFRHWRSFW